MSFNILSKNIFLIFSFCFFFHIILPADSGDWQSPKSETENEDNDDVFKEPSITDYEKPTISPEQKDMSVDLRATIRQLSGKVNRYEKFNERDVEALVSAVIGILEVKEFVNSSLARDFSFLLQYLFIDCKQAFVTKFLETASDFQILSLLSVNIYSNPRVRSGTTILGAIFEFQNKRENVTEAQKNIISRNIDARLKCILEKRYDDFEIKVKLVRVYSIFAFSILDDSVIWEGFLKAIENIRGEKIENSFEGNDHLLENLVKKFMKLDDSLRLGDYKKTSSAHKEIKGIPLAILKSLETNMSEDYLAQYKSEKRARILKFYETRVVEFDELDNPLIKFAGKRS